MALFRFDGWDYYPAVGGDCLSQANADGWFSVTAGELVTYAGRFNKGLSLGFSGNPFNQFASEPVGKRWTTETCVIGQAFYWPPPGAGSGFQFGVQDTMGDNGTQWYLQFELNGVIRLYRGGNLAGTDPNVFTIVATTNAKVWHENEWNYIEIKHKISTGSGLVEVRVNKIVVMSYVGPTRNTVAPILSMAAGWDTLWYSNSLNFNDDGAQLRWDDRYILDDTGANNIDYLGNVRVNTQLTTAAGDLTEMSVFGAAANWDAVNDSALTEAEYVYSSLVGDRDLYTLDPNVTAQNIFGLQVTGAWRQDDSTQMNGHHLIKTGGTIYEGGDNNLAQTMHYYRNVWELNPNTGVGWTAAELNALQAGQKLLAG
jgi:hypothetical protein